MLRPSFSLLLVLVPALGTLVQCGGESENADTKAAEASAELAKAAPAEKAPIPVEKTLPPLPETGTHLDGSGNYTPLIPKTSRGKEPKGTTIDLILRSSPPGATASIDGKVIGVTPTFWSGQAGHKNHDFTFVKEGYSMARYRFVAVKSGVVHASLSPLVLGAQPQPSAAQ
ncbi:MAG: PEGA domain-containing protein [Kofleriaceae bacterium]|nr:PEGA domain-containing protein [Kofleriaceae bacterium]